MELEDLLKTYFLYFMSEQKIKNIANFQPSIFKTHNKFKKIHEDVVKSYRRKVNKQNYNDFCIYSIEFISKISLKDFFSLIDCLKKEHLDKYFKRINLELFISEDKNIDKYRKILFKSLIEARNKLAHNGNLSDKINKGKPFNKSTTLFIKENIWDKFNETDPELFFVWKIIYFIINKNKNYHAILDKSFDGNRKRKNQTDVHSLKMAVIGNNKINLEEHMLWDLVKNNEEFFKRIYSFYFNNKKIPGQTKSSPGGQPNRPLTSL